jgi:ketosteroid isomerase-like protein
MWSITLEDWRVQGPCTWRSLQPEEQQMTNGSVSLESDVRGLLEAVDSKDTASLEKYFADGIVFRFGNSDPVGGKAAVLDTCVEFLAGIAGISHHIQHLWQVAPDWVVAIMTVHYTRRDGGSLSLPCANIFRFSDGQVAQYRIFMDINPVFA